MDPRLAELLARFQAGDENPLGYEELLELEQRLRARFDEEREGGAEVSTLRQLANDVTSVRNLINDAESAAEAEAREIDDLTSQVHPADAPAADEGEGGGDEQRGGEQDDLPNRVPAHQPAPQTPPDQPGEEQQPAPATQPTTPPAQQPRPTPPPSGPAGVEERQAVAASGAQPRVQPPPRAPLDAVARRVGQQPRQATPPPAPEPSPVTILAAGDMPGLSAGSVIESIGQLGRAFADKVDTVRRGSPGRYHMATFRLNPLADRELASGGRREQNTALIAAAVLEHQERLLAGLQTGLVASGGFCAPPQPQYGFDEIHTTARPIRDALALVPSTRGRITYLPPARLEDTAGGITIHDEADDIAGATKPCVVITCPAETTVGVYAIPLCIEVGNFDRITFPEHFDHWMSLALGQHARVAERQMLDLIDANSTAVTQAQELGAARDILEALDRQATARRNRFRMDPNAPVTVILQAWVRNMIRSDLARDGSGSTDASLALADATINGYFAARNIVPVWALEGRTGAGQDFGAQAAAANLVWPIRVEAHMFHPGAHFRMELPELNLGTEIRDSTLNQTNDVQAWLETFEGVGFNGYWSSRLRMDVCVNGAAGALDTVTCPSWA